MGFGYYLPYLLIGYLEDVLSFTVTRFAISRFISFLYIRSTVVDTRSVIIIALKFNCCFILKWTVGGGDATSAAELSSQLGSPTIAHSIFLITVSLVHIIVVSAQDCIVIIISLSLL